MISQLAKSVRESLKKALPNTLLKEEEYVSYKGHRLFFDFYLPTLRLYVEVQGVQHTEFVEHFHKDASAYRAQKKRDALKKEWCVLNDETLLCINHDEIPISTADLLSKIEEAQSNG